MKKRVVSLFLILTSVLSSVNFVFADEVEYDAESQEAEVTVNTDADARMHGDYVPINDAYASDEGDTDSSYYSDEVDYVEESYEEEQPILTSNKFTLYADVLYPEGVLVPSELRFNIFTEDGVWLANRCVPITEPGRLVIDFPLPTYPIGSNFILVPTTGAKYVSYYNTNYGLDQGFWVDTYAYSDYENNVVICDSAHVLVCPMYEEYSWIEHAEALVNSRNIQSETPYMIWVSKENFTVSVFLKENNRWECIKYFGCSIGAPDTPTVTGQYKYYKFEKIWDYGSYYVGPIIKFYNGYAIHTTLINKNGTDYDGRIGKMISHGCVRVRPENMDWLVFYIPLNTRIYVTNE